MIIIKDLEGRGCDLFLTYYHGIYLGTKENHEKISVVIASLLAEI
jgi:hypothetical protein